MELLRILKNKKFILAVILLLLFNCAFFYITQQKSLDDLGINIKTYSAAFKENADIFSSSDEKSVEDANDKFQTLKSFADIENLKAENTEEYELYAREQAMLIQENHLLYQEYKEGRYSYDELSALEEFYSHFAYQLEYQKGYYSYIDSITENGKNLQSKRLFADKSSFSYKSIQKSIDDFNKNKSLELNLVNDLPVGAVLNYQIGDFVLILMCVFLVIAFVFEKNVLLLMNTCKRGRTTLRLRQLPVLLAFALCGSFVVFISEILISLKIYNAPLDLSAAVQSSDLFADCVLHISFLQLFAIGILFKAAVAVVISLIIWLLISLSSNIIAVSGIAGAAAALELLLYKNISPQSSISFLKTFNIFSLFDYRSITGYNLVSLFSYPVRADIIIWAVLLLITVVAASAVILSARRNYPIKSPKRAFAFFYVIKGKLADFYAKLQAVLYSGRFESFKLMHIGKGLIVVATFIGITALTFNTGSLVFSSTEVFLNDYYTQYGGELNDEIYKSLDKMQAELEAVDKEFNLKSLQFENKEITFDEYELARAKSEAYDTQRKALEQLNGQVERIALLADNGIQPMLINEIGYNSLFFSQSNQREILLLLCAVVILFSSVFSIEKSSNMLMLNHCSKNGRGRLCFKKMLFVLPKAFALTSVSYISLILQNNRLYGLGCLNADIHNLECLQGVDLRLSIWEYMLLNFAFEFALITVVGLITAALSAFVSQLATIIISACVFVLPSALYMININSAKELSAIYQFNFNQLILDKGVNSGSFAVHAALAVFCLAMLAMSHKKWCTTKE